MLTILKVTRKDFLIDSLKFWNERVKSLTVSNCIHIYICMCPNIRHRLAFINHLQMLLGDWNHQVICLMTEIKIKQDQSLHWAHSWLCKEVNILWARAGTMLSQWSKIKYTSSKPPNMQPGSEKYRERTAPRKGPFSHRKVGFLSKRNNAYVM